MGDERESLRKVEGKKPFLEEAPKTTGRRRFRRGKLKGGEELKICSTSNLELP